MNIGNTLTGARPPLRVQLTALYAGLALAVVCAGLIATSVLFGTRNVLFGRSSSVDMRGSALAGHPANGHHFDLAPALIVLAVLAVTLAVAWWLAGRLLRPLREMNATAREISATNLHRRLRLDGPNDELTALGRTLDDLFERLEGSFEAQRRFVANASHELRTPLTGQRTLLQVALADRAASADDLRAACEAALALGDSQERLINALLALATGEKGIEHTETLDLAQLAAALAAGTAQQAEQNHVTIDLSLDAAPVTGDRDLIERMTANLLDNAIRHNIDSGSVSVATQQSGGHSQLRISNTGPLVDPQELGRLFQPFQRAGAERTAGGDGHGLGLAIVKAVADAHNATLTATPRPDGGLDVTVVFP